MIRNIVFIATLLSLLTFFSCTKDDSGDRVRFDNAGLINRLDEVLDWPYIPTEDESILMNVDIDNDGSADFQFTSTLYPNSNDSRKYLVISSLNGYSLATQYGRLIQESVDTTSGQWVRDTNTYTIPKMFEAGELLERTMVVQNHSLDLAFHRSWSAGTMFGFDYVDNWLTTDPYYIAFTNPSEGVLGYMQIHVTTYSRVELKYFYYTRGLDELEIRF